MPPRPRRTAPRATAPQSHRLYEQYEGVPLWRALAGALAGLEASREVTGAALTRGR